MIRSGEDVTVVEITGHIVITNEPAKVLLKDTISERIAELIDDSIEARFGGVGLPTAIKDFHEVITDLCNFVVVQVHSGHTFVVINSGVAHAPISVVLDGGVHECFDLTHVVKNEVNLFDSFNIEHMGESCNPLCATLSTGQTRPRSTASMMLPYSPIRFPN